MQGVPQEEYDACVTHLEYYKKCIGEYRLLRYVGFCNTPYSRLMKCLKRLYEMETEIGRQRAREFRKKYGFPDVG
ncbi:hypothetical protein WA026_000061 [Henosepilachna vigintioctopunctata]|uniref:COX assembly mitochondrial protein n=1 Tax=Henosepilachna vigintioctopunctata TaxID=420089 RepID=A0AAW1V626_9CUCU